jgi:tetratricopeptide (TPR) repeat protein
LKGVAEPSATPGWRCGAPRRRPDGAALTARELESSSQRLSQVPELYAPRPSETEPHCVTFFRSHPDAVDLRSPSAKLDELRARVAGAQEAAERFTILIQIKSIEYMIHGEDSAGALRAHAELGFFYNETMRPESALRHLERAAALLARHSVGDDDAMLIAIESALAHVALRGGQKSSTVRHVRAAAAAIAPFEDMVIADPRLRYKRDLAKGRIRAARGNYQAAIAEFEKALEALAEVENGAPTPDEAKLRVEIAETYELCGDRAAGAGEYGKAYRVFRKLGMEESAAKVRERLPGDLEEESHERVIVDQPSTIDAEIGRDDEEEQADSAQQLGETETTMASESEESEVKTEVESERSAGSQMDESEVKEDANAAQSERAHTPQSEEPEQQADDTELHIDEPERNAASQKDQAEVQFEERKRSAASHNDAPEPGSQRDDAEVVAGLQFDVSDGENEEEVEFEERKPGPDAEATEHQGREVRSRQVDASVLINGFTGRLDEPPANVPEDAAKEPVRAIEPEAPDVTNTLIDQIDPTEGPAVRGPPDGVTQAQIELVSPLAGFDDETSEPKVEAQEEHDSLQPEFNEEVESPPGEREDQLEAQAEVENQPGERKDESEGQEEVVSRSPERSEVVHDEEEEELPIEVVDVLLPEEGMESPTEPMTEFIDQALQVFGASLEAMVEGSSIERDAGDVVGVVSVANKAGDTEDEHLAEREADDHVLAVVNISFRQNEAVTDTEPFNGPGEPNRRVELGEDHVQRARDVTVSAAEPDRQPRGDVITSTTGPDIPLLNDLIAFAVESDAQRVSDVTASAREPDEQLLGDSVVSATEPDEQPHVDAATSPEDRT